MEQIKKMRKIGFFAGISMLIGSIIGSGIYFKNNSVFSTNDYSVIGTAIAWIVASVISLTAAISFTEIGRTHTDKKETGITFWSKKFLPKGINKFGASYFTFFYYGIYALVLGYLTIKFFFDALNVYDVVDVKSTNTLIFVFGGLALIAIFLYIHHLSLRAMGLIQSITVIVKTIPLFAILIFGIIFISKSNFTPDAELLKSHPEAGSNLFKANKSADFSSIILSIPMILFAYDAFTSAASMQNKIKNGEKRMPLMIFVSMIFIITLYLGLTIIQLLRGTGSVADTIEDIFPTGAGKPIRFVILFIVTLSAFGTTNGFVYIWKQNIKNQLEDKSLYRPKTSKINDENMSAIYVALFSVVLTIISVIIGAIENKNGYGTLILALSDVLPVMSFVFYGLVIFFYVIHRKNVEHNKMSHWLFYFTSITAVVLILVTMSYEIYILNIELWTTAANRADFYKLMEFASFWIIIVITILTVVLNKKILNKK